MPMKGGYKINGIPIQGQEMTTGTVFFVDDATGSSGNSGLDPLHPMATIDQAINKCTANKGDIIYVMPAHEETIENATDLVPDVAGISIIGLGYGSDMPEITYSATGSIIAVSGASTTFKNLRFIAGISAVATAIDVNADHFTMEGCMTDFGASTYDFVIHVDISAVDYATIKNNRFIAQNATAGANEAIQLVDCHHVRIEGNYISGDYARAAILGETTAGNSLLILHNYIHNDDAAAASNGIDLNAAFTGMIVENTIFSLYNTNCATLIDPGACGMSQNWTVNAEDQYAINTAVGAAST